MSSNGGSAGRSFFSFIPHQIDANWDDKWAPLLAGFPVSIQYLSIFLRRDNRYVVVSSSYEPDLGSFRETETARTLTYPNARGGSFRVEVVLQKGSGRVDTFKYDGLKLVAEATGSDFDGAMLQTTLVGIQEGERVKVVSSIPRRPLLTSAQNHLAT